MDESSVPGRWPWRKWFLTGAALAGTSAFAGTAAIEGGFGCGCSSIGTAECPAQVYDSGGHDDVILADAVVSGVDASPEDGEADGGKDSATAGDAQHDGSSPEGGGLKDGAGGGG
jgi:hypothetical protein